MFSHVLRHVNVTVHSLVSCACFCTYRGTPHIFSIPFVLGVFDRDESYANFDNHWKATVLFEPNIQIFIVKNELKT